MTKESPDVLAFQGQGTQEVGRGGDLAQEYPEAQEVLDVADDTIGLIDGRKFSDILLNGPKELLDEHSQLAIFVPSAVAGAVLQRKGKVPKQVAGHSLGEYAALWYAAAFGLGVTGLVKAVELVKERQKAMAEADEAIPGGGAMLSVIGKNVADIEGEMSRIAAEYDVDVAAINSNEQGVISGPQGQVAAAERHINERDGLRGRMLAISGAAHSRWNALATEKMRPILEDTEISIPRIPFLANNARVIMDPEGLRQHLLDMFQDPVRFRDMSLEMLKARMTTFTEVGKPVLSKFVIRTVGDAISTHSVDELLGRKKQ